MASQPMPWSGHSVTVRWRLSVCARAAQLRFLWTAYVYLDQVSNQEARIEIMVTDRRVYICPCVLLMETQRVL